MITDWLFWFFRWFWLNFSIFKIFWIFDGNTFSQRLRKYYHWKALLKTFHMVYYTFVAWDFINFDKLIVWYYNPRCTLMFFLEKKPKPNFWPMFSPNCSPIWLKSFVVFWCRSPKIDFNEIFITQLEKWNMFEFLYIGEEKWCSSYSCVPWLLIQVNFFYKFNVLFLCAPTDIVQFKFFCFTYYETLYSHDVFILFWYTL